jgi:Uri superfamily endonuclease
MTMFPPDKGTYILILHLDEPTRLQIGRLGAFDFAPGWYAYVGSAFGPGGLRGRLKHHLAPVTKPHWHIDYLRAAAPVREVWYSASETRYEHRWADMLLAHPGATVPVPRFGASDCTCAAHLVYLSARSTKNRGFSFNFSCTTVHMVAVSTR